MSGWLWTWMLLSSWTWTVSYWASLSLITPRPLLLSLRSFPFADRRAMGVSGLPYSVNFSWLLSLRTILDRPDPDAVDSSMVNIAPENYCQASSSTLSQTTWLWSLWTPSRTRLSGSDPDQGVEWQEIMRLLRFQTSKAFAWTAATFLT